MFPEQLVALALNRDFCQKSFPTFDRKVRPLVGNRCHVHSVLLRLLRRLQKEGEGFNWLLALSGLSSLFTWGGICISIRFRKALAAQGRRLG
nr:CFF_HP1_G0031280.mRNA.1.CDS.1 [Saccharomyces cerevisiae]